MFNYGDKSFPRSIRISKILLRSKSSGSIYTSIIVYGKVRCRKGIKIIVTFYEGVIV